MSEKLESESFPILVLVYDRLDKLKACVESITQSSTGAKNKILFISSDAPSKIDDVKNVQAVRSFAKGISGFKEVRVFERKENLGAELNYIRARLEIAKEGFKGFIVLEDDVQVYPGFIEYMDSSLIRFYDSKSIQFVSAYLPPGISKPPNDIMLLRVMTPYGVGIWFHKYTQFEVFREDLNRIHKWLRNFRNFHKYNQVNPSNVRTLPFILSNKKSPGDILSGLYLMVNNTYTLYPKNTLSNCTGFDGTGVNSPVSSRYTHICPPPCDVISWDCVTPEFDLKVEKMMARLRASFIISAFNYLIYVFFLVNPLSNYILPIYERTFAMAKSFKKGLN